MAARTFLSAVLRSSLKRSVRPYAISSLVNGAVSVPLRDSSVLLQVRQASVKTSPPKEVIEVKNPVHDKLRSLCDQGNYSEVVKEVASFYRPLVEQLEGREPKCDFDPNLTAKVEQEAVTLLVQRRQHEAAMLLYENLQDMSAASPLVKPTRRTMSFIVGMLSYQNLHADVQAAYAFAEGHQVYPTESMNASYLKALIATKQYENAAMFWRNLCQSNSPRNMASYRQALYLFSTLKSFKDMKQIADDVELHGIKLRELDYQNLLVGLSAGFQNDQEDSEDGVEYAESVLQLFDNMQRFDGINPALPRIYSCAMAARNYLGEFEEALDVYKQFQSVYTGESTLIESELVYTYIGLHQTASIQTEITQALKDKKITKANAMATKLMTEMAKQNQEDALFDFLKSCPLFTVNFPSEEDGKRILHTIARSTHFNQVELWSFLESKLPLLNLKSPFWWWQFVSFVDNARRWRLLQLMLESPQAVVSQAKLENLLKGCVRRTLKDKTSGEQNDDDEDTIDAWAFVVYLGERLQSKKTFVLQHLVTAYSSTNQHAKAIETFREFHRKCVQGDQIVTSPWPYVSAKRSLLVMGYEAEAKQVDTILELQHQAINQPDTNQSQQVISTADQLRELFQEGRIDDMLGVLDTATETTTLCCVNPTTRLIEHISWCLTPLPSPCTILSIGSGSGLLEFLLEEKNDKIDVHGVDVAPINVFLPYFHVVKENERPAIDNVHVLLAVYLRRPWLLITYLKWFPNAQKVILLGPKNEDPVLDELTAKTLLEWGQLEMKLTTDPSLAHWDVLQIYTKNL
ncbi:hypothetical protein THRCLA_06259 [Thraustotheca clavata]|uniref:Uncharacterized protein n=1 Tax=Thraustotheca clavata TaxID=74557 RepID=A0A1V9ZPY1_9STRA|nr:hypothetical protein THRCLA_06259 [Thraustotheca clavata]